MNEEDKSKDPKAGEDTNPADNKGANDGGDKGDNPKTFSQDDLNKILAERLEREQKKFEKTLQERLTKELAEANRLAKLSAEEKEKELLSKQQAELQAREKDLTLKENKLTAYEKLTELKLPHKFVDFVLSEDKETTLERIENLHKEFTSAVALAVEEQLKGETPKAPDSNSKTSQNIKTVF